MQGRPWQLPMIVIAGWAFFGLLMAVQMYWTVRLSEKPLPFSQALFIEMGYAMAWAALTPLALYLSRRFRLDPQRLSIPRLLVHIVAGAVLGLLTRAAHELLMKLVLDYPEGPFSLAKLLRSLVGLFDYGILLYGLQVLFEHVSDYQRRFREGELRSSRLETQLVQAQLKALETQLQPHFLFNTLNSISALLRQDVEAADKMIARLGQLLRLTLDNSRAQEVTVEKELALLRRFLEIEEIRFQDRLVVHFDEDPEARRGLVPNLLLQPIVENAIKHGVSKHSRQGKIALRTERRGDRLWLQVEDNGPGLPPDESSGVVIKQGFGVASTQERLEQLYGEDFSFDLSNGTEGGLLVTFDLPFRPAPTEAPKARPLPKARPR